MNVFLPYYMVKYRTREQGLGGIIITGNFATEVCTRRIC